MIKRFFIILIFILISISSIAKGSKWWTDIDTLQVFTNKTYVHYKTYKDSILLEDAEAFLYPTVWKLPKYRFFPFFFKKEVKVDSVVSHGTVKSYSSDGKYRIGKYDNGVKLNMTYFDSTGTEISETDFYGEGFRINHDPEQGFNNFLLRGE